MYFAATKTAIQKRLILPRSRAFSASFPVPSWTCRTSALTPARMRHGAPVRHTPVFLVVRTTPSHRHARCPNVQHGPCRRFAATHKTKQNSNAYSPSLRRGSGMCRRLSPACWHCRKAITEKEGRDEPSQAHPRQRRRRRAARRPPAAPAWCCRRWAPPTGSRPGRRPCTLHVAHTLSSNRRASQHDAHARSCAAHGAHSRHANRTLDLPVVAKPSPPCTAICSCGHACPLGLKVWPILVRLPWQSLQIPQAIQAPCT